MLNSAEHEILNALLYKKYQEIQDFSELYKPRMLFSLLINVKMPTIVGILKFMSRKNFMFNSVEHEKVFITSGPSYHRHFNEGWMTYDFRSFSTVFQYQTMGG